MAKNVSSETKALRRQAKKAAEAAGKQWSELPKKDRKAYLTLAGGGQATPEAVGGSEQEKAPGKQKREKAKLAAQQDGRKWKELSREQRQEYLARVRGQGA